MAEKSISSMMEVESLADTDMLVVSVGGETKKVSVKTLKDSIGGGGDFKMANVTQYVPVTARLMDNDFTYANVTIVE